MGRREGQKQKKLRPAVAAFRRAVALAPEHPEAHFNLGNALRELKELAESAAAFRKALALKPDHVNARLNLGTVLLDRDELDESLAAFREVIDRAPDDPRAHANLGIVLRALGERAKGSEGLKYLNEAVVAYRAALQGVLRTPYPVFSNITKGP